MGQPAFALNLRPAGRYVSLNELPLPAILRPESPITDDQYVEFCQANPDLRVERTATGDILLMAPTGGTTGIRNANLIAEFVSWSRRDGRGLVFDSSTEFRLPNGAARSPDLSWVERSRWDALPAQERERYPPLCPDFAVELRSPSDRLPALEDKCAEYIDNGARLVWLLDPYERRVHVYAGGEVTVLEEPAELTGAPLFPDLRLPLDGIL